MEFKELVGSRRSIRYYQPWRQVEREKIQVILEAARQSSRAVNASWGKAIVVNRDDLSEDDREALKTPTTTAQLDLAPTWIFWYADTSCFKSGHETLKWLVDVHALTPALGWSHEYVENVVYPQVLDPIGQNPPVLNAIACCEAGIAICQALLSAVDEGLGTQLVAFQTEKAQAILDPPAEWIPLWIQLVGYAAESADGGGARPREPFETMFFEGKYGQPWQPDGAVTDRLIAEKMIQPLAPAPWRAAEIRGLARMFGLPE